MIRRRSYRRVGLAWLMAALAVLPAAAQEKTAPANEARSAATPAKIGVWIAQLDDDRYLVREQATRQLLEAGSTALDPLLTAANADRPEPADRSVWVLQRLSIAKDAALRRQALEHLSLLKKRPQVAATARQALAEIIHQEALQAIEQLGGRYVEGEYFAQIGPNLSPRLILNERWHGGDAGLVHLRHLNGLRQVKILGTDISIEGLKELQHCDSLQEVWLYGTKLKPEDVQKLRKLLPEPVVIDYRRGGLLGVARSAQEAGGPAVVDNVTPDSAAAVAGIQHNDVIQKFNGEQVANFKALTLKIGEHQPGDEISIEVLRSGKPMEFKVKLGKWTTVE